MKIRSGFVSNSSSSSFVIMGVKVNKKNIMGDSEESFWEFMEDKKCDYANLDERSGEYAIGIKLAEVRSDDFGIEQDVWDIEEVIMKVDKIKKEFGLENLPTKIYTGTEAC